MTTTDWKEKRKRRHLQVSASQIETFRQCKRKWWLERVRGLRTPSTDSQVFGTVLHSVCERYLCADDLGRDRETGKPVDLYPPDWHIAFNKYTGKPDGEATPEEQNTIKRLISAAIEAGILSRQPGRMIEHEFRDTIIEGDADAGTATVTITGFIDLLHPDEVVDHKTTKSMRYAKSKKALRENTQVLIYAYQLIQRMKALKQNPPEKITLRHNVFCKDPSDTRVRRTEVVVAREEVEKHWLDVVVESAKSMEALRRNANSWRDLPDPEEGVKVCNAYGGCPYMMICAGVDTEESTERRLARAAASQNATPNAIDQSNGSGYHALTVNGQPSKEPAMSGFLSRFAELEQQSAAINGEPAAAAGAAGVEINSPEMPAPQAKPTVRVTPVAQQPAATPAAATAQPAPAAGDAPPWASSQCSVASCGGRGFNTAGRPCAICDTKTRAANGTPSSMFIIEPDGQGNAVWVGKEGTPAEGMEGSSPLPSQATQQPVKTEERVETQPSPAPAPATAAPAATQHSPTPAPVTAAPVAVQPETADAEDGPLDPQSVVEAAAAGSARGPGRPKKGFTLIINAEVSRGEDRPGSGRHVYPLDVEFKALTEAMVEQMKREGQPVASFYDINAFTRRDGLAKVAPYLAEKFRNDIVTVSGLGTGVTDMKALVDALRPFAGMVIVGTGA